MFRFIIGTLNQSLAYFHLELFLAKVLGQWFIAYSYQSNQITTEDEGLHERMSCKWDEFWATRKILPTNRNRGVKTTS